MSIFKKKIEFPQFIANLMQFQFDFIETNFNNFIDQDDEYEVLTAKDKKDLYSMIDFLVLADLTIGCITHLNNKISNNDISYVVSSTYIKFLSEYKNIGKKEVENKAEKYMKFIEFFENLQDSNQKGTDERKKSGGHPPELSNADKMGAGLCMAFANYYSGKIASSPKNKTSQGRNFAAFKFAMALVKGDIVGQSLREYSLKL